jgi:hypothetical protein
MGKFIWAYAMHNAETPEVGGGAGGARALPSFGISVNPIRTKGADYARHITTGPPHLFGQCGVSEMYRYFLWIDKFRGLAVFKNSIFFSRPF